MHDSKREKNDHVDVVDGLAEYLHINETEPIQALSPSLQFVEFQLQQSLPQGYFASEKIQAYQKTAQQIDGAE